MFAGPNGIQSKFEMGLDRRCNGDRIDARVREQFLCTFISGDPWIPAFCCFPPLRTAIGDGHHSRVWIFGKVAREVRSPVAKPNDAYTEVIGQAWDLLYAFHDRDFRGA